MGDLQSLLSLQYFCSRNVKINRISIIDEMNLFLPSGVLSLSRITRVRGFRSR